MCIISELTFRWQKYMGCCDNDTWSRYARRFLQQEGHLALKKLATGSQTSQRREKTLERWNLDSFCQWKKLWMLLCKKVTTSQWFFLCWVLYGVVILYKGAGTPLEQNGWECLQTSKHIQVGRTFGSIFANTMCSQGVQNRNYIFEINPSIATNCILNGCSPTPAWHIVHVISF